MATTACELTNELIAIFECDKQLKWDSNNDTLLPSVNRNKNPYSVQCLADWVYRFQQKNEIIRLDFNRIQQDLQQLIQRFGTQKCKGLFYPHLESYYRYTDTANYAVDQANIQNVYKQLFGDTESIIHYILRNKSFLFQLPTPDVDQLQSKLDAIMQQNGEDLLRLNEQQSVYILRLLLLTFALIPADSLYEDCTTILIGIEEELRDCFRQRRFFSQDTRQLYLQLMVDLHSVTQFSCNQQQSAMINLFQKGNRSLWSANFFDSLDCAGFGYARAKMSIAVMKELLFRGIPPFQFMENRKYTVLNHEYTTLLAEIMKKSTLHKDDVATLRVATLPVIICEIANEAKRAMYTLLDQILHGVTTQDCIHCILQYIYMDWNALLPADLDQYENNMVLQAGKLLNYLGEIELSMQERNELLDGALINASMAKFLFSELSAETQQYLIEKDFANVFHQSDESEFTALYRLLKMQKLSKEMLRSLVYQCIHGRSTYVGMKPAARPVFVDIVAMHMFGQERFNDAQFMQQYKEKMLRYIHVCYEFSPPQHSEKIELQRQFIDGVVNDCFCQQFLDKVAEFESQNN